MLPLRLPDPSMNRFMILATRKGFKFALNFFQVGTSYLQHHLSGLSLASGGCSASLSWQRTVGIS